MGLVTRWFNHAQQEKHATSDYIDLSDYASTSAPDGAASTLIRMAEVAKHEDLKEFAGYVYDGNVLILDVKKVMQDEIAMKRLTNDLRKLAQDVGGDLAGVGDALIMVCPAGVRMDRRKLKATPQ